MKSILRNSFLTFGILMSLFLASCAAAYLAGGAAAGIMIYSYMHGELERKYPADFLTTWQATIQTIEQLEFEKDSRTHDAISGQIKARRATGTSIRISLEQIQVSPDVTSVRIRIGTEGNKTLSQIIHNKIAKNIQASTPDGY